MQECDHLCITENMSIFLKKNTLSYFISSYCYKNFINQDVYVTVIDPQGTTFILSRDLIIDNHPDSKVHGPIMGPIWGRQDPGGPHVGLMNFAIWAYNS